MRLLHASVMLPAQPFTTPVQGSGGTKLIFLILSGMMLCFGFRRETSVVYQSFGCCWAVLYRAKDVTVSQILLLSCQQGGWEGTRNRKGNSYHMTSCKKKKKKKTKTNKKNTVGIWQGRGQTLLSPHLPSWWCHQRRLQSWSKLVFPCWIHADYSWLFSSKCL